MGGFGIGPVKILTIASGRKHDSYLEDLTFFLREKGADSSFCSMEELNAGTFFNFFLPREDRRFAALKRLLGRQKPDCILISSSRMPFDLVRLRSCYRGKIAVYDMEGPNFQGYGEPAWFPAADLVITVSRLTARTMAERFREIVYLPHSVNPARFHAVAPQEDFLAPLAFIGRPSPHRCEYLAAIAPLGLRLYGRKWPDPGIAVPEELRRCCRGEGDVHGERSCAAISGATLFVNVLQDQFLEQRTLMNMQIFMVTACGTALATEFVEELPDAFEPGSEVLVYSSREELAELAARYTADKGAAARIAEAGFRRCMADHTMKVRAGEMLKVLEEL